MLNKSKISILTFLTILMISNIGKSQTYCEGDSFSLNAINYQSGEIQWQFSLDGENWEDYFGANGQSLQLILNSEIYLRARITDPECLPAYYSDTQHIILLNLPSDAIAGSDQLNIAGTSTVLSANSPDYGTGFWSIIEGDGGVIAQSYSPSSEFSGLPGNTYTLRWVVYNDCGFNQDYVTISFMPEAFNCGTNLTDSRDGQEYPTVEIGGKCWMAKNLNIGTMINGTENQTDETIIEKYCYANNSENCNIYGGLYQWNQAMMNGWGESIQGICPSGWHIPSDEELKQLEISLGMSQADADLNNTWRGAAQEVGTKMKQGGSSGFETMWAGARNSSGNFMYMEGNSFEFAYFWSTTEATNTAFAFRRCLQSSSAGVGRYDTFNKQYGFSVRCVKD